MTGRALRWMTWAVALLALLSYGLYLALGLSGPPLNGPAQFTPDDAVWVLGQVLFAIVGAVVVSRRPKLPIGWLFCTAGLLGVVEGIAARAAVNALAAGHGRRQVVRPPGCPQPCGIPTLPCWYWVACCFPPAGRIARLVGGGVVAGIGCCGSRGRDRAALAGQRT